MNRLETRSWTMELRSIGEPDGHFSGYASVFGVKDSYGTIFDSGCFKKTLKEHKGKFPVTWFHDPMSPVGLARVEEDEHGLLVDGDLDITGNDVSRRVYAGLKFGYVTEMSHGFWVVRHKDDDEGVEHFTEVKLIEVALLTSNYAANPEAVITAVREAQAGLSRMRQMQRDGATAELLRVAREVMGLIEGIAPVEPQEPSTELAGIMRELTDGIRALNAILAPGLPTSGRDAPPLPGGEPDKLHSLLDTLREYSQILAGRR